MRVFFNLQEKEAKRYGSESQKVRFLSEYWVGDEIFCPHCGEKRLHNFENNRPVADFYCENCDEEYELKSKKNNIGSVVLGGSYEKMIERLREHNNPNFFFLSYDSKNYSVKNFMVIPKHFFTTSIIKKRKPLSVHARRTGWVGCNILLENIPNSGKIFYVKDGQVETRNKILDCWQKTLFLRGVQKAELLGWLLDVMNCIDVLNKNDFTLQDMYSFESILGGKHPENKNIKPKIRQQLQFLRDKGYLTFMGDGRYKVK